MDQLTRNGIQEIYEHVLQVTNKVLTSCKSFHIEILKLEDPSYDEIAEQLTEASEILGVIANSFPSDAEGYHLATKAKEYTQFVIDIARAIRRNDEERLGELVAELDRRPFI